MIAPFSPAVERLDEILGVGITSARVILAESGWICPQFPTAAHLASWVRFAPGVKESASKTKHTATATRALGEAAVAVGKTDTRPLPSVVPRQVIIAMRAEVCVGDMLKSGP
ncbi:MAG: transposase [Pseudonocardiaceae bacterium]